MLAGGWWSVLGGAYSVSGPFFSDSLCPISTLAEIEDVIETLPTPDLEKLFAFLALRLGQGQPALRASTSSVSKEGGHSVLDIPAVHVGRVLRPPSADDDLLSEMLEGRV